MGMKADQVILSRLLPKTGQETIYEAGDDGEIQAGWWLGLRFADNKERFAPFVSNGDNLVLDRATGLIWPAEWDDISFGLGLNRNFDNLFNVWLPAMNAANYGGFSDWRIPNAFELCSLINFGQTAPCIYSDVFSGIDEQYYWTGTTNIDFTDWAFGIIFHDIILTSRRKTEYCGQIAVRGGL